MMCIIPMDGVLHGMERSFMTVMGRCLKISCICDRTSKIFV